MKIIDLLNKIANGEEVPKKIKYKDFEYLWHDKSYGYCRPAYDCTYICFFTDFTIYEILDDEVEIIEEETKPLTKESFEALGYAMGEIKKCIENGFNKSLENKPFSEADSQIEKLDIHQEKNCKNNWKWKCNGYNISTPQKIIGEKLNEVIIKLNNMEDNK